MVKCTKSQIRKLKMLKAATALHPLVERIALAATNFETNIEARRVIAAP
jgi:hypothetical protein